MCSARPLDEIITEHEAHLTHTSIPDGAEREARVATAEDS